VEFEFVAHSSVTRVTSSGDLIHTQRRAFLPGSRHGRRAILLFTDSGKPALASLDGDTVVRIEED